MSVSTPGALHPSPDEVHNVKLGFPLAIIAFDPLNATDGHDLNSAIARVVFANARKRFPEVAKPLIKR
jgi:hypothetical protein